MTSRREKRVQQNAHRKSVVITTASITAVVVAALCGVSFFSADRDITSIEKSIPADSDIVFVSDSNEKAWKYFATLAGTGNPFPTNAEKVGFASNGSKLTTYLSVKSENTEEVEKFLQSNSMPFVKKGDVYAITSDDSRITEQGLGDKEDYRKIAGKGSDSSFGYINFSELDSEDFPEEMKFILPSAGVWSGEFKNGQWDGKVDNADYSGVDDTKTVRPILENIHLENFSDGIEYKKGTNTVKGNFSVNEINSFITEDYSTIIRAIDFEINGNRLTFTLR